MLLCSRKHVFVILPQSIIFYSADTAKIMKLLVPFIAFDLTILIAIIYMPSTNGKPLAEPNALAAADPEAEPWINVASIIIKWAPRIIRFARIVVSKTVKYVQPTKLAKSAFKDKVNDAITDMVVGRYKPRGY